MSSGKPRPSKRPPTVATRDQARARAEQLGLTWKVVAKNRDWARLVAALEEYAAGQDSAASYPSPIRRDGLIVTDAIQIAGKLVRMDTTKLTITREEFDGLSSVARLQGLKYLDILRTAVTDLTPLSSLTKLEELDISDTKVADLTPLAGHTKLRELSAQGTLVEDLTPLENLVELESLWVSGTPVTNIAPLAKLVRLKTLALGLNLLEREPSSPPSVSDIAPLTNLKRLELLYLTGSTVTNLRPLAGLTRLKRLFLYGVELPAAAVAELQQALPNTKFFGP